MQTYELTCHPATPARDHLYIHVNLSLEAENFTIIYGVYGTAWPKMPAFKTPKRSNGLWQTTCFELFVRPDTGSTYYEFNFSPSSQWAAYEFDGYREGMRDLDIPIPKTTKFQDVMRVDLEIKGLNVSRVAIGLSAVIEETDGTKSYWALRHPPGPPDFHHPNCFTARLPAFGAS